VNKNLLISFWLVVLMAVSWTAFSSYTPVSALNVADGTVNTILAAVKAASTAPAATDPALVVGLSPNSSQPQPLSVSTTDFSSTITTGGTAQVATAANTSRKSWCVQNPSTATELLYVRLNGTASATTGTELTPGSQVCSVANLIDTSAISVFAATTGHAFKGSYVQ